MRSIVAALFAWSLLVQAPAPPPAAQPASADLPNVLARASAYVVSYVKSLSSVVSEERYDQNLYRKGERTRVGITGDDYVTQTLVSDYLLVAVSGTSEWLPFRDVYSVNGTPIRDRNDRLLKLFIEAPADAYRQALRIRDESSRYNIGSGFRDTNVPTFALQFLSDQLRRGLSFTLKGRERRDGVDAVVVDFVETASPTTIVGAAGEDVPAKGRYLDRPDRREDPAHAARDPPERLGEHDRGRLPLRAGPGSPRAGPDGRAAEGRHRDARRPGRLHELPALPGRHLDSDQMRAGVLAGPRWCSFR